MWGGNKKAAPFALLLPHALAAMTDDCPTAHVGFHSLKHRLSKYMQIHRNIHPAGLKRFSGTKTTIHADGFVPRPLRPNPLPSPIRPATLFTGRGPVQVWKSISKNGFGAFALTGVIISFTLLRHRSYYIL